MAKRSKEKGNLFERKVAADILRAAGARFGKKDCYRTPQSGGHEFAGKSDLIISEALQAIFPFVVECKHQKTFRTSHLFFQTEIVKSYHAQVLTDASRDPFKRLPLLVMRGSEMRTYVSVYPQLLSDWGCYLDGRDVRPILHYQCLGKSWCALPFEEFLGLFAARAEAVIELQKPH